MHVYHHSDFLPLNALAEDKARAGRDISLVIPALDEEETIGDIVGCLRRKLIEQVPLLNEIVVMDGNSSDQTADRAAAAGACVHRSRDVLPEVTAPDGKGTSMWKALAVVRGDLVVYVDADIRDFGARFAYGLIGALLRNPGLRWSKAFYRRPLSSGGTRSSGRGGRVTELLVRPLLALWYPELAALHQPLSGEYALWTDVARSLPFSSGYGVETRLLLGMYDRHGLDALGQVDMDVRHHRNRPVEQLGQMSFSILRVFTDYLKQAGRMSVNGELGRHWRMPGGAETSMVEEVLPPMADVAGPAGT